MPSHDCGGFALSVLSVWVLFALRSAEQARVFANTGRVCLVRPKAIAAASGGLSSASPRSMLPPSVRIMGACKIIELLPFSFPPSLSTRPAPRLSSFRTLFRADKARRELPPSKYIVQRSPETDAAQAAQG